MVFRTRSTSSLATSKVTLAFTANNKTMSVASIPSQVATNPTARCTAKIARTRQRQVYFPRPKFPSNWPCKGRPQTNKYRTSLPRRPRLWKIGSKTTSLGRLCSIPASSYRHPHSRILKFKSSKGLRILIHPVFPALGDMSRCRGRLKGRSVEATSNMNRECVCVCRSLAES